METLQTALPSLPMSRVLVMPDWIDGNNHVNAACYLLAVKEPAMEAHEAWDYGAAFRARTGESNFVLESSVRHFREIKFGGEILVTTRIVDLDDKRLHLLFELRNERDDGLAAIVEYLTIHVRLSPAAARPFPGDLRDRLRRAKESHAGAALADEAKGQFRLSVGRRLAV